MLGGSGVQLYASSQDSLVSIGKRTFINQDTAIVATTRVEIGEDCLIGDQVSILDTDFHAVSPAERHTSPGESAPIRIGNNVWLAARVMKGVTIGDNTVVAAGAVVTSSLPANVLAGGVPAKVIRAI
jgi:maltose O-acetyltransferase